MAKARRMGAILGATLISTLLLPTAAGATTPGSQQATIAAQSSYEDLVEEGTPTGTYSQLGMALDDGEVRSGPGRGNDTIGYLTPGEIYSIEQTERSDGWSEMSRVDFHGMEGWTRSSAFVVLPDEPRDEDFTDEGMITGAAGRGFLSGISDGERWSLYRYPHTNSRSVGTLSAGQPVSVARAHTAEYRSGINTHLMTAVKTEDGTIGWTFDENIYITGNPETWDTEVLEEHVPLLASPTEDATYVCQLYAGEEVRMGNPFGQYLPVDHGSDIGYIQLEDAGRFRDRIADGLESIGGGAKELIGGGEDGDDGWVTQETTEEEEAVESAGGIVKRDLVSCAELDGRPVPEAANPDTEDDGATTVTDDGDQTSTDEEGDPDPATDEVTAQEQTESEDAAGFPWWLSLAGGAGLVVLLLIGGFIAKRKMSGGRNFEGDESLEGDAPQLTKSSAAAESYDDYDEPEPADSYDDYEDIPGPAPADSYDDYEDVESGEGDPLAALFNQRSDD